MARPRIKNKKQRVNLTLDRTVVKQSKEYSKHYGVSLSSLVEQMLASRNAEMQRAIDLSPPEGWRETCDGKGCICEAHDQCECACDADWTPKEVYELTEALISAQAEIASLKKDADHQHPQPKSL
jgi:hypothetical protein